MASKCVINNHGSSVGVNRLQYLIGILLLGLVVVPFAAYSNDQIPLFDDEYTVQKYAFAPISAMSSEEADEYVGKSQWFYKGTAGGALYKCDGGFNTSHKVLTKAEVYAYDPVHRELGLNGNKFRLTTLKCGDRSWTWEIVSTVDDSVVYYGLDGVLFKLVRVSESNDSEMKGMSKKRSSPIHDDEDTETLVDRAGKYYNKGEYRKAAKLYAAGAQKGDVEAQEMLAIMYKDGDGGLEKNHKAAIELIEKLAEQDGTATHQFIVGAMYHRGGPGLKKNMEKSLFWFRKAEPKIRKDAALGNVTAQNQLGSMYYEGSGGLKKSYTTSMYWYRKAAEQGSRLAQFSIGLFYYDGEGVEKDYREATKWFRKAAEQGFTAALNMLDRAELRNVNKIAEKQELQRVMLNEYVANIQEKIQRNWIRPPSTDLELSCAVEVELSAKGEVTDVNIMESSGVSDFDISVEESVHKASPLPMPPDPEVSKRFRRLRFEFKPDGV